MRFLPFGERYPEAIASYQLALGLRPDETGWRYELALAYWQSGKVEEAFVEARRCTLAVPGKAEYRDLLEKINKVRLRGVR